MTKRPNRAFAHQCLMSCSILAWAGMASANVVATFTEGAPKDRFAIVNTSNCTFTGADLLVDLSGSSAGLIFDVTAQGAGVEVFQPLDLYAGQDLLSAVPAVRDGDQSVSFRVPVFAPTESIAFTIDVDDTKQTRGITVSSSEIIGARVSIVFDDNAHVGVFADDGVAVVTVPDCPAS